MRLLFPAAPLQSFYPSASMFKLPHAGEAPRPYQGLDMRKVHDCPWENVWTTRRKMETGYQWANWSGPSIHAMTAEEVATFFNNRDYHKYFTIGQMARSAWHQGRFCLMFTLCIVFPLVPTFAYIFYMQKWEPMEIHMDPEEYYKNYRWHYYGPDLDHHSYVQYLEARRANIWREAGHNTEEWIPPQFRGEFPIDDDHQHSKK